MIGASGAGTVLDLAFSAMSASAPTFTNLLPILQVTDGGIDVITHVDEQIDFPKFFELQQNYPNPFNPSTTIKFALPEASKVTLQIFNEVGQLVATLVDGEMQAGRHAIIWNGRNQSGALAASGLYFYKLMAQRPNREAAFIATRRITLLK